MARLPGLPMLHALSYYSFCLEYSFSHCPSTPPLKFYFLRCLPQTFCSCIYQNWHDYLMSLDEKTQEAGICGFHWPITVLIDTRHSALFSVKGCLPCIIFMEGTCLLEVTCGSWDDFHLWTVDFTSSVVLTMKMNIWWTPISVIIPFPGGNLSSNYSKSLRHYE